MGTVLAFGFTSLPEILAAERAVNSAGAELRPVAPRDWTLTVGELAEGKSAPPDAAPAPVTGKMLVFCGLEKELDALLSALRSAGVAGRRAVLTEQNRRWLPARLLTELEREHAAILRKR